MRKYIRALEVPFYLLVIALACLERGNKGIATFLCIVSVARLIINVIENCRAIVDVAIIRLFSCLTSLPI